MDGTNATAVPTTSVTQSINSTFAGLGSAITTVGLCPVCRALPSAPQPHCVGSWLHAWYCWVPSPEQLSLARGRAPPPRQLLPRQLLPVLVRQRAHPTLSTTNNNNPTRTRPRRRWAPCSQGCI